MARDRIVVYRIPYYDFFQIMTFFAQSQSANWHTRLTLLCLAMSVAPVGGAAQERVAPAAETDPVARLLGQWGAASDSLPFDATTGWLLPVLEALNVPVSSQTLVFSRTSLQTDHIGPWAPRALYFNDDVYVGFVQNGGLVEVAAVRPSGGTAFYSVPQAPGARPAFVEESTTCLMCHESRSLTGGVAGLIMRSVLVDRLGYPVTEVHEGVTTGRTPLEARWGGWYVHGAPAAMAHAGNVRAPDLRHEVPDLRQYLKDFDFPAGPGPEDGDVFDPTPYPTPYSDAVALMVLMHQVQTHNLMSAAQQAFTDATRASGLFQPEQVEAATFEALTGPAQDRLDGAVDRLVDALVFAGEVPLPGPITSPSGFATEFASRGPFDAAGRSLRDMDLNTRVFRYPLSFLIYSEPFDHLPTLVRERIDLRLGAILDGSESGPAYAHLDADTRRGIREILADTKPGLAGR